MCCVAVYTGFATCEYVIVASNIGFHLTCAVFDLKHFSFNVVRGLNPQASLSDSRTELWTDYYNVN